MNNTEIKYKDCDCDYDNLGAAVQRPCYYASGTPFVLPVDSSDGVVAPLDSVSDRLHIGNRWLDLAGLAMYDNTARVHDPIVPHFLTVDALATKNPSHSPFSHCAGNPANMVDPTGMAVIADQWCQEGIRDGLSESECRFVQFDNSGLLNLELINSCNSIFVNMTALKNLDNSTIYYIINGANECIDGGQLREMADKYENGLIGKTYAPGLETDSSPDGNVYVVTSLKLSALDRASNIAHELYGHCYLYNLSKTDPMINPWHKMATVYAGENFDEEFGINEVIYISRN